MPDQHLIKTYQTGYINGYLEAISDWYNLQNPDENDFLGLTAFWAQAPLNANLNKSFYNAFLAIQGKSVLADELEHLLKSIQFERIDDSFFDLQHYIYEPLPAEDLLTIIRDYVLGSLNGLKTYRVLAPDFFKKVILHHQETTVLAFESGGYLFFLQFTKRYYYP